MGKRLVLPLLWMAISKIFFASAVSPIKAVGSKFFLDDGTQFFIKGVAYQLTEDDPLVNVEQCQRDAALMKDLGANAIRVYHVNASSDHTGCMAAFADANIYAFVDLDSFQTYIAYQSIPSWNQNKSDAYRAVMDEFSKYDNTAGFFVGNENLNGLVDSGIAPYLLAATVDLKAYRDARAYRKIPIGYSATDTGALPMLQDYFVCRPNETERLEFYALNSYRWCGDSTYEAAYSGLQEAAEGYPVPIWFSEVGCNTFSPRRFTDQQAVFSQPMVDTWSGSIVYEWIQEINDYGLVTYGPQLAPDVQIGAEVIQGFTRRGIPTPIQPDFDNLKTQWATMNPSGVASQEYAKYVTSVSRGCPVSSASGWTVDPSAPLPTLGQAYLATVSPMSGVTSRSTTTASPAGETSADVRGTSSAAATSSSSAAASKGIITTVIVPENRLSGVRVFLALVATAALATAML